MICLSCDNLLHRMHKTGGGEMFCIIDKSKVQNLLDVTECSKFKKREDALQGQDEKQK